MEKKSTIKREFLATFSVHMTAYVAYLVVTAALSYIAASEVSGAVALLSAYKWAVTIAIFALATIISYFMLMNFRKNRPNFPSIETDYNVMRREIYYEYLSKTKLLYKRRYTLRANRNGLNTYIDRYRWTGEGSITLSSPKTNHRIVPLPKKSVWEEFEIRFPTYLQKGETIETEVVWDLNDANEKAVPFISLTVQEPTDIAVLELKLPKNFDVKEVICEHAPCIGAKVPFTTKKLAADSDGRFVWEIEAPALLHHYEMRWFPIEGA